METHRNASKVHSNFLKRQKICSSRCVSKIDFEKYAYFTSNSIFSLTYEYINGGASNRWTLLFSECRFSLVHDNVKLTLQGLQKWLQK